MSWKCHSNSSVWLRAASLNLPVLDQISYWGFWAPLCVRKRSKSMFYCFQFDWIMPKCNILPITPAITGPWFSPMRSLNLWNDSRLMVSRVCIRAMAKSTSTTTLCSSVRLASWRGRKRLAAIKYSWKCELNFLISHFVGSHVMKKHP